MFCQWRRTGRGRRPPAPYRTGRHRRDYVMVFGNVFRFYTLFLNSVIYWFKILFNWFIPGANDQIYARRSLHSPTDADGRKALCRYLSASPAKTPLLSQCLEQQQINWRTIWKRLTLWFPSLLIEPTCGFMVHVRNIQACKTCSKSSFPNSTLTRDEDLIMNGVHSYLWGHHWRLQQACKTRRTIKIPFVLYGCWNQLCCFLQQLYSCLKLVLCIPQTVCITIRNPSTSFRFSY